MVGVWERRISFLKTLAVGKVGLGRLSHRWCSLNNGLFRSWDSHSLFMVTQERFYTEERYDDDINNNNNNNNNNNKGKGKGKGKGRIVPVLN
jgi:hypothetical protein